MPIPTSRTSEIGTIVINPESCTGCGKCVLVCKDFSLCMIDNKVHLSDTSVFGCMACGQCMAVCPTGAITVHGRTLSENDLIDLPAKESAASFEQLEALYKRRRSVRDFKDKAVEQDKIQQILDAASSAPMGLPPSDVNVLVLDSKEKVRAFAVDFCDYLDGMRWLVSKGFLALMRPFWGKANHEMFTGFVKPMFDVYTGYMRKGINVVNYDAPLCLYFYGSPYADPADPIVAATAAMYAGESLGLGTCMLGAVHPMIQNGGKAKQFREKHGIKYPSREGVFVIFGYPAVTYKKTLKRTFASVTFAP
jgi:ferredoxin